MTWWVIRTWAKITVALGLGVLGVWLFADTSGPVLLAVLAAVVVEVWAVRALAREWAFEARTSWWWTT